MPKATVRYVCDECGQRSAQWSGRCSACGSWGQVRQERTLGSDPDADVVAPLVMPEAAEPERRSTGLPGLDRVLGGGFVSGSVVLLAGPPGIGKSTLLLQWLDAAAGTGATGLLVSGEESHRQVAARARRLGAKAEEISFAPGRDLAAVLDAARACRPTMLAVDSVQTLRDTTAGTQPGGVAQVRGCVDALVELAKTLEIAVVLAGHVTKDGDLAGPRALEHAVDVVLTFEGDPRSGLRIVSSGKNRFGAEGEAAWFQMAPAGLEEIDPSELLCSGAQQPGSAVALPLAGRRALAVEIQALVGSSEGPARRQVTGLDLRRFQQVAAVLDHAGFRLGRSELFGAVAGGIRVDDPAADLAIAAALASADAGKPPPQGAAFVGEISLTGRIRPAQGMPQRAAAARSAGCELLFAPSGFATGAPADLQVVTVGHVAEALDWALSPAGTSPHRLAS